MNIRLISSVAAVALFATGSVAMAQGAGGHKGGMSPSAGQSEQGGGMSKSEGGSSMGAGHQARATEGASAGGHEARAKGDNTNGREAAGGKEIGGAERGGKSGHTADAGRGKGDKQVGREAAGRTNTDPRAPKHADRGGRDRDTRVSERSDRTNINIRVGGTLPAGRGLNPLSADLIRLYPQYRGYRMVVINDETVIVDPSTRRIVKTVSEGRSVGMDRRSTSCR